MQKKENLFRWLEEDKKILYFLKNFLKANYFSNNHHFFSISCSHSRLQCVFFWKWSEMYFIVKKNENFFGILWSSMRSGADIWLIEAIVSILVERFSLLTYNILLMSREDLYFHCIVHFMWMDESIIIRTLWNLSL